MFLVTSKFQLSKNIKIIVADFTTKQMDSAVAERSTSLDKNVPTGFLEIVSRANEHVPIPISYAKKFIRNTKLF